MLGKQELCRLQSEELTDFLDNLLPSPRTVRALASCVRQGLSEPVLTELLARMAKSASACRYFMANLDQALLGRLGNFLLHKRAAFMAEMPAFAAACLHLGQKNLALSLCGNRLDLERMVTNFLGNGRDQNLLSELESLGASLLVEKLRKFQSEKADSDRLAELVRQLVNFFDDQQPAERAS